MADAELNDISAAIKAKAEARQILDFDISGFLGLGAKEIPRVGIRKVTPAEQDRAWVKAQAYVNEIAGNIDQVKSDRELLQDTRAAFIVFEHCREVVEKDPGVWEPTGHPAFPGPRFMKENFTTDQVGTLLYLIESVRSRLSSNPTHITDALVDVMVDECMAGRDEAVPEARLAHFAREPLAQAFVALAVRYAEARQKIAAVSTDDMATILALVEKFGGASIVQALGVSFAAPIGGPPEPVPDVEPESSEP